jgi:hypothetical protein
MNSIDEIMIFRTDVLIIAGGEKNSKAWCCNSELKLYTGTKIVRSLRTVNPKPRNNLRLYNGSKFQVKVS